MSSANIDIDARDLSAELNRLATALADTAPAMREIKGVLLRQVEDNFASQSGPLGRWPALARSTVEGRVARLAAGTKGGWRKDGRLSKSVAGNAAGMMILQRDGHLASSVHGWSDATEAGVGAGRVYAAIHQFGGTTGAHAILPRYKKALAFGGHVVKKVNHPGSRIPARPFLPIFHDGRLQTGLEDELLEIVRRYVMG